MKKITKSTLSMARTLVEEWKEQDMLVLLTAFWMIVRAYCIEFEIKDPMQIFRSIGKDVSILELGYE